mgnify:CR=1 FL=1
MRSHRFLALAAVFTLSTALCSCSNVGKTTSEENSAYDVSDDKTSTGSVFIDDASSENYSQVDLDTESIGEESTIDNTMGYISPFSDTVCIYYKRISDHEIMTNDGKLKGSFTYEVNESKNEIEFTTTYENLSDESICADFRPSIPFISDKKDDSSPIVTADFDGHTIAPGESYSFTTNVEIGEYSEVMLDYKFCISVDPDTYVYENGMSVSYTPEATVFPFIIHLFK